MRTSGTAASRAASSAWNVDDDPLSLITPSNDAGRPSSSPSHRVATSSSSVAAGDVRQSIACWLSAAVRNSASTPGALPVLLKYAKNAG
jgi:hypothetical protein